MVLQPGKKRAEVDREELGWMHEKQIRSGEEG